MSSRYITLHPQYFLKEGFGTLMSHYAVMYSLHKDLDVIPIIPDIDFSSQNQVSAMQGFNHFSKSIIYHHDAFANFKNIFLLADKFKINQYDWKIKNFINLDYSAILKKLNTETENSCCLWSLSSKMIEKYLDDIINYLYIFNNSIIQQSKNIIPITNKSLVAVCVRNEYKTFACPHTKLSIDFYIEAMKQFDINKSKYLIFSDDIEECKIMFGPLEKSFDISYTNRMQSAIGLCTMSLCDHVICANSSFSYWASMLNKNIHKKIVCSTKFIDETVDLNLAQLLNYKWYPSTWIALDIS